MTTLNLNDDLIFFATEVEATNYLASTQTERTNSPVLKWILIGGVLLALIIIFRNYNRPKTITVSSDREKL